MTSNYTAEVTPLTLVTKPPAGHYEDMGTTAVVSVLAAGIAAGIATSATLAALLYRRLTTVLDEQRATRSAVDELAESVNAAVDEDDQSWYWTPEWQEGERRADEDLAAGRSTVFRSEEEMDTFLDAVPLPDADPVRR